MTVISFQLVLWSTTVKMTNLWINPLKRKGHRKIILLVSLGALSLIFITFRKEKQQSRHVNSSIKAEKYLSYDDVHGQKYTEKHQSGYSEVKRIPYLEDKVFWSKYAEQAVPKGNTSIVYLYSLN